MVTPIELDKRHANCAFEDEEKGWFCYVARDQTVAPKDFCELCLKAKLTGDFTFVQFLSLHPELNQDIVLELLKKRSNRIYELPTDVLDVLENIPDSTPLRSIHHRLISLPPVYVEFILT